MVRHGNGDGLWSWRTLVRVVSKTRSPLVLVPRRCLSDGRRGHGRGEWYHRNL